MIDKKPIILLLLIATSCFEEDKPLLPYDGSVTVISDNIEYYHSYFDFETNSVMATFPVNQWALGFGCGETDYTIITNSGNNWFIHNTLDSNIKDLILPSESVIWDFDRQSAFPDSTAIGEWFTLNNNDTNYTNIIYILGHYIGKAYDEKYMIRFLEVTPESYVFYFKDIATSYEDTLVVGKNHAKNYVFFQPREYQIIDPEPELSTYDIIFGPYYKITTQVGITSPYLVRGVLINPLSTQATTDSVFYYESIDYSHINVLDFHSQRDIIGFNWKQVYIDQVLGTANYKVKLNYSYIIQTQQGNYYKMHFLNYQINGENGFPTFEFEKLTPITGI